MDRRQKLQLIQDTGVIAIIRAGQSDGLLSAVAAIRAGGVRALEVTMTTPGALDLISAATADLQRDVLFGAGSVLDPETARAVILAGADFVVTPTLSLDVIRLCNRYSIPIIAGCFTPTEALAAWEAGADMIKLFPTSLGGPSLVKAILAPLPQLEIVAVGGVELDNAADFIRAGAKAIGVGSNLVNDALIAARDTEELKRRATRFVDAVKAGRGG